MLSICRIVFSNFNEQNIRYCSFKSNQHLLDGLCGDTDLDILIDLKDYEKVKVVFAKLQVIQFEPDKVGAYPNVVNWYGFDKETGKLIHFHIHFELMTGKGLVKEFQLPWGSLFLENSIIDESTGVRMVSPQFEYVLLCTRSAIKRMIDISIIVRKHSISKDILVELEYLSQRIDEDTLRDALRKMYSLEFSNEHYEEFRDIRDLEAKQYYRFVKIVRNFLRKNKRYSNVVALMRSLYNRTNRRICMKLTSITGRVLPIRKRCCNGGISFAFVGVDGSGKSTVSRIITEWLSKEFDIAKFYCGSGDGKKNWLSSLMLRLYGIRNIRKRKANGFETSKILVDSETGKKPSFFKAFGASIAYIRILKDNIKNLRKSICYKKNGIICIMDRYPQNSVPGFHDGAKLSQYLNMQNPIINRYIKKEAALLALVSEYPYDIVFVMRVCAATSFNRKPEESLESLQRKVDTIDKVIFAAKNTIVIDAEQPLEDVVRFVKGVVWEKLFLN